MTVSPPRLALWMLNLTTDQSIRSELIGDLQEEFDRLHRQSTNLANGWYWRQTIFSLPQLIGKRLRSEKLRQCVFGIAVSLTAFGLVRIWDVFLAQNLARIVSSTDSDTTALVARIAYFAVMMAGIAAAGALVARTTFCIEDSFRINAWRSLAPASLAIFSPYLFAIFFSDQSLGFYPLFWVALAVPSLIGGARFATWIMSKRVRQ